MTLQSLKTYGRIVVRLKTIEYKKDFSYYLSSQAIHQIILLGRMPPGRTLFAIRPYHQAICYQIAPPNLSLYLASNPYLNTVLLHHQKSQISDSSKKPNRTSSFLSPLPVASNSKCPKATLDATNFSHRGVKQTPRNSALLCPVYRAAWPRYGSFWAPMLTFRAKHHSRLVLFHKLSLICKIMRLFRFRWIQTRKG